MNQSMGLFRPSSELLAAEAKHKAAKAVKVAEAATEKDVLAPDVVVEHADFGEPGSLTFDREQARRGKALAEAALEKLRENRTRRVPIALKRFQ
jgi:hypothetical protein